MFSALWAIANQEAGSPLGQAAPYLYSMPTGIITTSCPITPRQMLQRRCSNTGIYKYTAAQMAGITGLFVDAMWDYHYVENTLIGFTFGTDSGLTVTRC